MNKVFAPIIISLISIAFVVMVMSPTSASATIAFVKYASSTIDNSGGTGPQQVTTTITVAQGDLINVSCWNNSVNSAPYVSVTDGTNTYKTVVSSTAANQYNIIQAYSANVNAGTYVVNCKIASGQSNYGESIVASEWSGINNTAPVEASSSAFNINVTVSDPGAVTILNANDAIVNGTFMNGQNWSSDSPKFTSISHYGGAVISWSAIYNIPGATGTFDATSTWATTGSSLGSEIVYRAATSSAVTTVSSHIIRGAGRTRSNTGR